MSAALNPPAHTASLIERHVVAVRPPVPNMRSGPAYVEHRQRAWAYCSDVAEQWALAHDLVIDVEAFENQTPDGAAELWGVRFTVVVGTGEVAVSPDTETPPWVWSERWRSWLVAFRHMDRPRLQALPGGKVITINRGRRA